MRDLGPVSKSQQCHGRIVSRMGFCINTAEISARRDLASADESQIHRNFTFFRHLKVRPFPQSLRKLSQRTTWDPHADRRNVTGEPLHA